MATQTQQPEQAGYTIVEVSPYDGAEAIDTYYNLDFAKSEAREHQAQLERQWDADNPETPYGTFGAYNAPHVILINERDAYDYISHGYGENLIPFMNNATGFAPDPSTWGDPRYPEMLAIAGDSGRF